MLAHIEAVQSAFALAASHRLQKLPAVIERAVNGPPNSEHWAPANPLRLLRNAYFSCLHATCNTVRQATFIWSFIMKAILYFSEVACLMALAELDEKHRMAALCRSASQHMCKNKKSRKATSDIIQSTPKKITTNRTWMLSGSGLRDAPRRQRRHIDGVAVKRRKSNNNALMAQLRPTARVQQPFEALWHRPCI